MDGRNTEYTKRTNPKNILLAHRHDTTKHCLPGGPTIPRAKPSNFTCHAVSPGNGKPLTTNNSNKVPQTDHHHKTPNTQLKTILALPAPFSIPLSGYATPASHILDPNDPGGGINPNKSDQVELSTLLAHQQTQDSKVNDLWLDIAIAGIHRTRPGTSFRHSLHLANHEYRRLYLILAHPTPTLQYPPLILPSLTVGEDPNGISQSPGGME